MRKRISASQRHQLMSRLMKTAQGRARIAQAMQEPLRVLRDYVSQGRRALMIDELPDGALPIYDSDPDLPAYIVGEEGDNYIEVAKSERLLVPTFEIASNPTIPFTQVKERRFDIVGRVKKKSKDELFRREDRTIFGALISAADLNATHNVPIDVDEADFDVTTLIDAMAPIESYGLRVDKMYMNPYEFRVIRKAGRDFLEQETLSQLIKTGLMGTYQGTQIYQSAEVPKGRVLLCSEPEYVGVLPVRMDLTVLPADEPSRRRFGWSIFEAIGIGIHGAHRGLQLIRIN